MSPRESVLGNPGVVHQRDIGIDQGEVVGHCIRQDEIRLAGASEDRVLDRAGWTLGAVAGDERLQGRTIDLVDDQARDQDHGCGLTAPTADTLDGAAVS